MFAAAYGLTDISDLVDIVLAVQSEGVEEVRRLAEEGHEPQAGWVAEGHLDELAARVAWSREHRYLVE